MLQFILGSSGSGKSNYLYKHILTLSKAEPQTSFFIIVPEQFTLQAQRELVRRQENQGIMNIDVVSFQRLAFRIFDELGKKQLKVMEDIGKGFVLRKIAEEKKDELRILKGNMKKPGYINEMKSMISELSQYRISPEQLSEIANDESQPLPFRYRISDIQLMYQGFLDYLEDHYVTGEEVYEVLAREADKSKLLEDSVLVLDGFTGFTPIQYHLLGSLFLCVKDIYVGLTLDKREKERMMVLPPKDHLSYMSKKTIRNLADLARDAGQEFKDAIWMEHGGDSRFRNAPSLRWLEQNIFRTRPRCYQEVPSEIAMYSLPTPRQELVFAAGEIQRLVREEGFRYREIAIVCGDVSRYGTYVAEVFQDFGVPFFLDQKSRLRFQPLTEMIRNLLFIIEQDFTYESVFAWLRCGLSSLSMDQIDLLENYVLANRIRGFASWKKKWIRRAGLDSAEELEALNEARKALVDLFSPLVPELKSKKGTVREKTVALYGMIITLDIERRMEEKKEELEAQGNQALSMEYAQIYKIIMDLLDKLILLLGDEKMDLKEYRTILEAGLDEAMVGTIPSGYDRVIVGDIERSRLPSINILFLVGVNDGLIPRTMEQGGLLTVREREVFAEKDLELAPSARERAFFQKLYLYLNLTKPKRKLYLTWHLRDGSGKEAKRSYLIGTLLKMFPNMPLAHLENTDELARIVTEKSSRQILAGNLQKARHGELSPVLPALYQWFEGENGKLLSAAFSSYEKAPISEGVAKSLYEALHTSVTRFERFCSCAYAHFMAYGIGLKERELGEFESVDMGSLFHEGLKLYSQKMEEAGYRWQDVPAKVKKKLLVEAVNEAEAKTSTILFEDARTKYVMERIKRILMRTIDTIGSQMEKSDFSPEGYEMSFRFHLGEDEKKSLQGRIDRIDTKKEENNISVRVVDYKSGNPQFQLVSIYHGIQLQLVVYLNGAVELLRERYPDKKIQAEGMLYYHLDDPVIDIKGKESQEDVQKKVLDKLALNGMSISSGDASVNKKSQEAQADDLKLLSDYVDHKIQSVGMEMLQGNIATNPYQLKERTACDHCNYRGICGFDEKIPGDGYRRLGDRKDALDLMRKELEGKGDEDVQE